METDLFGMPVGKRTTRVEWATRWPTGGPAGAKPGYTSLAADRDHAESMASGPAGAQWLPGKVVRREVVTITGPWEEA